MDIKTKYSIGDEVFYISCNRVFREIIDGIFFSFDGEKTELKYNVTHSDIKFSEDRLFVTKEELLKTL